MVFAAPKFDVFQCMPTSGALLTYVNYASLVATNGSKVYHLGSSIPIMLNELNLRGLYLEEMKDQGNPRPFTVLSLLLGRSADGKSTSAMTAIKHIGSFLDEEEWADDLRLQKRRRTLEFDGTIEGLKHVLATEFFNQEQQATIACLYQEEFTTIFQKSHGVVAEFLLRIYDGRSISEQQRQHQRATDAGLQATGVLQAPKINGLFCSTPDWLTKTVSQAMASGGLVGRLLIFSGEEREQPYEGNIVGNQEYLNVREQWRLHNLEDFKEWSAFLEDCLKSPAAGQLTISNEAHDVFEHRHQMYQKLVRLGKFDDNMRAMLGRASRTSWMIAALYATTRYMTAISADDARQATKLVDYCFNMGEEISSMFDQTETAKRHKAALQAITTAKTQGASRTDIHQAPGINGKGIRKVEMHDILESLEDSGAIVRVNVKTQGKGRPTTMFYATQYAPKEEPRDKN